MPWKDVSLMSQREEFVVLARHEGVERPAVVSAVWH
jgi:hypothetical protein